MTFEEYLYSTTNEKRLELFKFMEPFTSEILPLYCKLPSKYSF